MSRNKLNWQIINKGLIALGVSLTISSFMVLVTAYFHEIKQEEFRAQDQLLQSARARMIKAQNAKTIIDEYLQRYVDYQRQGIIGDEQRLNWIESLLETTRRLKLPSTRYRIQEQKPFSTDYLLVENGNFDILTSEMTIAMESLHEADLFTVLDALARKTTGLVYVRNCEMRRLDATLKYDPRIPNITSECNLSWFTVKHRDENNG